MSENLLFDKVLVRDSVIGFGTPEYENYLAHALCLCGSLSFRFNDSDFTLSKGDLMIVRQPTLLSDMKPSEDFEVKIIYIDSKFVQHCTPQSNYGVKGQMALFKNPVMRLNQAQFDLCLKDFESVEYRCKTLGFVFYEESIRCAVQLMILDFFDFHAYLYNESSVSAQYANIMNRFLELLETGIYRTHREVTFYASELCVTSKYLSEICKKVSGHSANFWINRYTSLEIARLLRDKSLTFVQISDIFNFSSPAYFSRYVRHNLGMNPTDYRD